MPVQNKSNKFGSSTIRKVAPLALVMAALLGTTILTAPAVSGTAQVVEQTAVRSLVSPSGFADLVEQVKPAVISVRVRQKNRIRGMSFDGHDGSPRFRGLPPSFRDFFEQFRDRRPDGRKRRRGPRRVAQGSGFFISADGYAVTNNHVVEDGDKVEVVLSDGAKFDAEVIGTDAKTDLALLKIKAKRTFQFVRFADKEARVGDWVIAVGNPFGLGGTVTTGIISARGREIGAGPYDDFLQIDAAINRGNSGGPAFNIKGEVIGVNTAIYSPSGGNVGIGFAIPASLAKQVIGDLRDDGAVTRGWLGVNIQNISEDIAEGLGLDEARGALVSNVTEGSPADKAGLRTGDAILKVNGGNVKNSRDLARRISRVKPGDNATLTIMRDRRELTKTVRIGRLPGSGERASKGSARSRDSFASLGLRLGSGGATGNGRQAVVVDDVDPDGVAASRGIRSGDLIVKVAGTAVATPGDVKSALTKARNDGRKTVLFLIRSGKTSRFVPIPVKRS